MPNLETDRKKSYLVTYHGTLVCYDPIHPRLYHQRPSFKEDHDLFERLLFSIELGSLTTILNHGADASGYMWSRDSDGLLSFMKAGNYLRATPDGQIDTSAEKIGKWEQFYLLNEDELEMLREIASHQWVRGTGVAIVLDGSGTELKTDFQLTCCGVDLNLRRRFPILRQAGEAACLVLFANGWQPELLRRYCPLVFVVAIGSDLQLNMAVLAIRSFQLQSKRALNYLIITDRDEETISNLVPFALQDGLFIHRVQRVVDILDAYLLRYRVGTWPASVAYGPILYVDTDVLCADDPECMLANLARSEVIEVAAENYSPLNSQESVGAKLISEEAIGLPWEFGFNSGVIGIPYRKKVQASLELVCEVAHRCAETKGRAIYKNWYDQVPANYVAVKMGGFGVEVLTTYVVQMLGISADSEHDILSFAESHVLTHLWGAGPRRLELMTRAVEGLEKSGL